MEARSRSQVPGMVSGATRTRRALSAELVAILGVGATLGILTLTGMQGVRADMRDLRVDVRDMGARLAGVEQRLVRVEERVKGVEQRLDGVEKRLDGVEERLVRVEERVVQLDHRLTRLEASFEAFRETIAPRWPPGGEAEG